MPVSVPGDFTTLKGELLALGGRRAPSWALGDRNYLGIVLRALAWTLTGFHKSVRQADADALPTQDTSKAGLDRLATRYGLSNGAGGYGRLVATAALGLTGVATGENGRPIPANTQLLGPDGSVVYKVRTLATIPGALGSGTGQVTVTIDAVTTGAVGNLSGGSLAFNPAPAGIDGTVTIATGPGTPAEDGEDDGQLLARLLRRLRLPPKSGAPQDYRRWAETPDVVDYPTPGLPVPGLRLWMYPNYFDLGCPLGVATVPGTGNKRVPTAADLAAVELHINGSTSAAGQRAVGAVFAALAPFMPTTRLLRLRCRVLPASAPFAFDWPLQQLTSPHLVSTVRAISVVAGSNFALELTGLAPAALKTAVQQGSLARIQVDMRTPVAFGGPVIPEQVPVVAVLDGFFNAGKSVLALSVQNPNQFLADIAIFSEIYPGGPAVDLVAQALLTLVDNLGPSRASGLADPTDSWDDTLGINAIAAAAQGATWTDGVTPVVKRALTGGVLLGVGPAGVLVASDVQASDSTLLGPELLAAGRILVTD